MKPSKLALAALVLSLVPFEVKRDKDGTFSYKSLLVGVSSRKKEDGKQDLVLSLFNLPDFLKKERAEAAADPQAGEPAEPAAEPAAAESPATEPDIPEMPAEPTA